MIRSFIALELKDKKAIENIQAIGSRLKQNQPNLKVVEPENLHMTVKFLGNIKEEIAPKIFHILQEEVNINLFQGKSYEFKLMEVGQFRKYSVIWIKLEGEVDFLQKIKDVVEEQLFTNLKIPIDQRAKFEPHLTIGRLKSDKINYKNFNAFKNLIFENKQTIFGTFLIEKITLKRSELTPKGPIYTDLIF